MQASILGRLLGVLLSSATLGACVSTETSSFDASDGQQSIVRDGIPALVSRKSGSVVLVRQAQRDHQAGTRPAYVIGILNTGKTPINFAFSGIQVTQDTAGAGIKQVKTWSYDDLVREEKQQQFATALIVGLGAAANSYSAANAGYYNGSAVVSGPYGTSNVSYSGYSPLAASIAQTNASIRE